MQTLEGNEPSIAYIMFLFCSFQPYLKSKYAATTVTTKLDLINARMELLPRATDFALPFCNGNYIPGHSRVQAKEHRNIMQVLPFLLQGIDDDLTELAAL